MTFVHAIRTAKAAIDALKACDRLVDNGVETDRPDLDVEESPPTPNVETNAIAATLGTDRVLTPKAGRMPPAWND